MNAGRLAEAAPPDTVPFRLERRGIIMGPLPGEPTEAGGVLNPATGRSQGETYLFPRIVAQGNFSRIGRARVLFDASGTPTDVERLGIALEPEEAWEWHAGGGGVEDPRITYLPRLERWIMTYSAFGPFGPRIGLAASADLERWERLGPALFGYRAGLRTDLGMYPNKDALLFPEPVPGPDGRPAYAMLHRPMWDLSLILVGEGEPLPAGLNDPRPGIWVSFAPADAVEANLAALTRFEQHRLVALPEHAWEALKIGGGTPPVRIDEGWLLLHHGVTGALARDFDVQPEVRYCAGAIVLDATDVTRVIARSRTPILEPQLPEEVTGTVGNVVFPTAIEQAQDGDASAFDVYYGMADRRIGVARLSRIATATAGA
jgi:predicted GH43/DUF377 family glycosyl hydrolase